MLNKQKIEYNRIEFKKSWNPVRTADTSTEESVIKSCPHIVHTHAKYWRFILWFSAFVLILQ